MQTEDQRAYHREHDAIYRIAHRDILLARHRKYNATHKGESHAYTVEHKGEQAIRSGLYYVEHREDILAQSKTYYVAHAGEYLTRKKKYAKEYPERRRLEVEKRRALKYANTPTEEMLTHGEWLAILAEANGYCHYCGKEAKLTLDHVIPLSRGGKHSKDNVVPACMHCNCSKHTRMLDEWMSGLAVLS